jgi:hypothetical protein
MRTAKILAIVLGSIGAAIVCVLAATAVLFVVGAVTDPGPYQGPPTTAYTVQVSDTLQAFDSHDRLGFDRLYPHESEKDKGIVWHACSIISPHGRTVDRLAFPSTASLVRVPVSGVSRDDPRKHVDCTMLLDAPLADNGSWEVFALIHPSPCPDPRSRRTQFPPGCP